MKTLISMNSKEYRSIHDWIRRRMKHITECSHCGCAGKLDNALISGLQHDRNIDNYIKLCRTCHYNYDHPNGLSHSEETKELIGTLSKERIKKNGVSENFINSRKGSKISEDHKKSISLAMSGENHHQSKLTESNVKEIRTSNLKPIHLATKYNVTYETINNILKRKTWKNLD